MNAILAKSRFEDETKHLSEGLCMLKKWELNELEFPFIDVSFCAPNRKKFRMRLDCRNYNQNPVSISLLQTNGDYLMKAPIGTSVINPGVHLFTRRPFICTPGSFEYHSHPQHARDYWSIYRNDSSYNLVGMIMQIHDAWLNTRDVA